MIQDPPGNEVRKAEQTALSKACISARKKGLLPRYLKGIMPSIKADQNHTHTFSLLCDTTEFCSSSPMYIPFGVITAHFSNFFFYLEICFIL